MGQKLKILFISRDFSTNVEKSTTYLSTELSKLVELSTYHQPGNINAILATLSHKPDFILLNDFKPDYCPTIRGLNTCTIPVGAILHDLQYKITQRKKFYLREHIKLIFSIYRDPFLTWYPEFKERLVWFPFHVPLDTFKDYQLNKTTDWLMMGSMNEHYYPFRQKMYSALKDRKGFLYHKHPGYRVIDNGDVMAGKAYAQEINKAKMFLTCDSILHFPLLKYYEALACNTLLLAPSNKELEDLGFIDKVTFVAVNEQNFMKKAEYYLHHEKERLEIAKNGFEMVRSKHSTKVRAEQLIQYITNYLKNK